MTTTARPAEGYREMLLSELIESYAPIYPEGADWFEVARTLYEEQPEHMEALSASLREKGWRNPIRLSEPRDLDDGEVPKVFDGTHRVAIALCEGVISVPVVTGSELPPYIEAPQAELEIAQISGDFPEDDDWRIFDLFGSFSLNGDIWLNSDIGLGSEGNWRFFYDLGTESYSELRRRVEGMLEESFPDLGFKVTVTLSDLSDEDDD